MSAWEQIVESLEAQGAALRAGKGGALQASNQSLALLTRDVQADARDVALVRRARELAQENALLLLVARDQVQRALAFFQTHARTGIA
ncbi:MAG: hypothetical protein JKY65_31825 [Planctomycetes bacterium]|nr:hypothetical protein [Planctomycetota bacterium]